MKNKKKILIIEDDRVLVKALRTEFEEFGYDVRVFMEGEGAYEEVVRVKPDLIILDLVLPGVHGFEILKKVNNNKIVKNIPVIIVTNLGEDSDKEKAFNLGAYDFLIKASIDLDELSRKINKVIKR